MIGPRPSMSLRPDVNTNDRVMAWIMDTYAMHKRQATTAVVTGKPMELGGSRGRKEATGRGCMIVTMQALKQLGMAPRDARIVIQGFGNVGGMAAKLMAANGFRIVAIVEYDGAVYNAKGLDIAALAEYRHDTGSMKRFPRWRSHRQERSDVPRLRRSVADRDRETSSPRPTRTGCAAGFSARARTARPPRSLTRFLAEKKVFVIPDILANAGGVTVSYFEWVQDRQGFFWNEDLVNTRLEEIMVGSFGAVTAYAAKHKVDNRTAAYMLALDRVAIAMKLRGIYA